jgi:hypothetical protein
MTSILYLKNKISALNTYEKEALLNEIKNAPKQEIFLKALTENVFLRTNSAIEQVYSEELKNNISYSILQNRFYKLKKKLGEIILALEKRAAVVELPPDILHEHELEYYTCRRLIKLGNYLVALERLNHLEQHLKHIEAYEILHKVNSLQMYCTSRLGKMKELKKKLHEYEKNIELFNAIKKSEIDEVDSKVGLTLADLKPYADFLHRRKRMWLEHKDSKRLKLKYNYLKLEYDNYFNSQSSKKINTKRVISTIDDIVNNNYGICMYTFSVDHENERDREILLLKITDASNFPEKKIRYDDEQIRSFAYNSPSFRKFSWLALHFQKKEDWKNTFDIYDFWVKYCDSNNIKREKLTVEFNKMKAHLLAFPLFLPKRGELSLQQVQSMIRDFEENPEEWSQLVTVRDMFYLIISLFSLVIDESKLALTLMAKIKRKNLLGINKIIYENLSRTLRRTIQAKKAAEKLTAHSNSIEKEEDRRMIEAVIRIIERKL